ncbi:hypothetical protein PV518_30430 [Streptomyces sp. ND04-05B]|nr:hypothetical protein [Streptomyces sp. ND04-05B]
MPKKRKKDRKAPQKRASVRTAPAQRADLGLVDWDEAPEEANDPLDAFAERFSAPVDAVKAAQAGERVEWTGSIDGSTMRHRVLLADDGTAAVEQAVFVGGPLEELLLCAWHQAGEQGREVLEAGVLAALDDLHTALRPVLEAEIREVRPDYTAAVPQSFREEPEPYGPGMPVFGWRLLHPVGPDTTWEDTAIPPRGTPPRPCPAGSATTTTSPSSSGPDLSTYCASTVSPSCSARIAGNPSPTATRDGPASGSLPTVSTDPCAENPTPVLLLPSLCSGRSPTRTSAARTVPLRTRDGDLLV